MKRSLTILIALLLCLTGSVFANAVIPAGQKEKLKQQQKRPPQQSVPPRRQEQTRSVPRPKNLSPRPDSSREEVLDIVDVWRELDYSSEIWLLIIERQPKEITIREYIRLYNERGIRILKSPAHYVDFIDGLLAGRPQMIRMPFKDVFRFATVMEYDFNNGQNMEQMALKLLGQKAYEENKRRLNK